MKVTDVDRYILHLRRLGGPLLCVEYRTRMLTTIPLGPGIQPSEFTPLGWVAVGTCYEMSVITFLVFLLLLPSGDFPVYA